jgi:hypothetical protein
MNPRDPYQEIGDLLRSQQPDPQPSPGLEMHILRALPAREKASRRIWPWFLLPPAVAMGVVILWPKPGPPAVVSQQPKPVIEESTKPATADEVTLTSNPLEREKVALQRDAQRAGRFLIDCLPSLGSGE